MVQGGVKYPSIFTVDGGTRPPPLPPKPGRRQRSGVVQTLLVILVSVALFGMLVEACLIYNLYISKENTLSDAPMTDMRKQEKEDATTSKAKPRGQMNPPKPMAHLNTGRHPDHTGAAADIVLWTVSQESILYKVKHKVNEGKLIIQKEGYYSVYSKVHFKENSTSFSHSVLRISPRYPGEILLLQSSRLHPKPMRPGTLDNSYLSGVFHLFEGDALFVRVKNCIIVLSNSAENYFGVFMV
nr:tumor necrosis factor ligand superfamily member 14 [Misgurnus anguillicaudatus]XP_055042491.1 tumor necrosis factor ligand superfamily member 14 [Misgurnus anguillicaudatus]XP_055042499.1 tumor necrosis factor ligand superfamily member 14 [Misgurnus anguillicaudatus]